MSGTYTDDWDRFVASCNLVIREKLSQDIHFHLISYSCNSHCRSFVKGRRVPFGESQPQIHVGETRVPFKTEEEQRWRPERSAFDMVCYSSKTQKLSRVVHYHDQGFYCNDKCCRYVEGKRMPISELIEEHEREVWRTTPSDFQYSCDYVSSHKLTSIIHYHDYGFYCNDRCRRYFKGVPLSCEDSRATTGTIERAHQHFIDTATNKRTENKMEASYNVSKLIEKLTEKRDEAQKVVDDYQQHLRDALKEKIEAGEDVSSQMLAGIEQDYVDEHGGGFGSYKQSAERLTRSIEKLELLAEDEVTLSDDDLQRLGL